MISVCSLSRWVTGAVLVAMAAVACGGGEPTSTAPTTAPPSAAPVETASSTPTEVAAACGPEEEQPLQDGSHLIGDAEPPVPYSSTPATSGWHASGNPRTGFIDQADPLTDPELVLTLEVGQVVLAYDPERVDAGTVGELETLTTGTYAGKLTTTPYTGAEEPVTLVAWGLLQSCTGLDTEALDAFVAAHADPVEHG